jgi:uncharacterized membrane protein YeaQ/YmgE (transglycosylase-associated protein family)
MAVREQKTSVRRQINGQPNETNDVEVSEMHWIWFIIVGAVVGALGRLLHRGNDPMGWLMTIAIGVASMIVAAAISSGWLAFVIGVAVAVVLVALVGRYRGNRHVAHA